MLREKHYRLDNILSHNAEYNVIYGERSNGKTTAVLEYALKDFCESGYKNQLAIIRRWEEDFRGKNGQQMCGNLVNLGWVEKYSSGAYNGIWYYSSRWYLVKYNKKGEKEKQCDRPFAYGFAITSEEHYKSSSYPDIRTILFDEFISRRHYIPEEFVSFQNLLSTIIRLRTDIKIFMCGNTINKYCPYFNEMGLKNVKKQKQGTIDIYTYGDSVLKVAVEYSDFPSKKKESNKYFAFDNPKLKMITGGGWEIDIYPHLPYKYKPSDILYKFYVVFDEDVLQGNIISVNKTIFIYMHRKTTPIADDNHYNVYQLAPDPRRNYKKNILAPYTKIDKKICELIITHKIFYQDNEVGEVMNNYMNVCRT